MDYQQQLVLMLNDIQRKLISLGLNTDSVPHLTRCREIVEQQQPDTSRRLEGALDIAARQLSRNSGADKLWPAFSRLECFIRGMTNK